MSELGPCTLFAGNHAELARLLLVLLHEILADGPSKSPFLRSFIASPPPIAPETPAASPLPPPPPAVPAAAAAVSHRTLRGARAVALVLQGGLSWFSFEVPFLLCTRPECTSTSTDQPFFLFSVQHHVCLVCWCIEYRIISILESCVDTFFTAGHQFLLELANRPRGLQKEHQSVRKYK